MRVGEVPVVEVVDLSVSYRRGTFALRDFNIALRPGSICMVLGPSGSGKSTLLKALNRQVAPASGQISIFGEPLAGASPEVTRRIASIPQSLGLVRNLTVLENTLTGALGRLGTVSSFFKLFPELEVEEARGHLRTLGIEHKIDDKVYSLSGGERQRVAIARALMQRPRLVLADEFVSQLDLLTSRDTMRNVSLIAETGVTFLVTSHEAELVAEFGDTAVFLREGRKVHECPAGEVDRAIAARLMEG
jgi:phosphonate transport system ATP-binding protein